MASSSGQDKERERKAQEADFNRVGQTRPARTHKETEAAHPGNISSDSSTVIGKGRDRRTGPKK
jgi:hypothetical protein